MDAENGERVAVLARDNRLDIGRCCQKTRLSFRGGTDSGLLHAGMPLFRRPTLCPSRGDRQSLHAGTFQISLAYSRIVRSEENQPTRATLWIAFAFQTGLFPQSASTLRCAAA
jgi:hypothetical protein